MNNKNKTTAGLLGIFLGAWGAHHFYLGNTGKGLLYLLLSLLTGICLPIFAVIGLIEGIGYFGMTDEEFQRFCSEISSEDTRRQSNEGDGALKYATEKYKLLLEYKALLDSEAITAEEFESIKRYIMR